MFDFQRFTNLMQWQFILGKREIRTNILVMFGIASVLLGGILTIGYYKNQHAQEDMTLYFHEIQRSIFGIFVCISASVFTSKMFAEYGEKNSAIAALMLPATKFEKWLAPFLLSTVGFLALVTAVFWIASVANLIFFNSIRPLHIPLGAANGIFTLSGFGNIFAYFCCTQAIYFLGSIHFNKNQWWSTTLAVLVGATVFGINEWLLGDFIRPNGVQFLENVGQWSVVDASGDIFRLPVNQFWTKAITAVCWLLPPVFWWLSYLKLTEKQV